MGKVNKTTKTKKYSKRGMSDKTFNAIVMGIMIAFLIIVLYPLTYVVSSSLSSGTAVTTGRVLLWPVDFSISVQYVFF